MSTSNDATSDIKKWVAKALLDKENVVSISSINIAINEAGEGYMGDIVFVHATGTTANHQEKQFDLVLKCSKPSMAFRETLPVQEAFLREILLYDEIFPAFRRFQESKLVEKVFNSVAKYYGKFTTHHQEVIILENLKTKGFELWDKKLPLTTEHLLMVCREYGKFHAISVAMQDQDPNQFEALLQQIGKDVFKVFYDSSDWKTLIERDIDFCYEELKHDLDDEILSKWRRLKGQLDAIFGEQRVVKNCLKVISHGDCWNNNFMYKHDENERNIPIKSAILDWQISFYISPITDLSYFLFCNMNKIVAENYNLMLDEYYESFCNALMEMGSDPIKLYPKHTFLQDWKQFGLLGVVMSPLIFKVGLIDKSQAPDMGKSADKGESMSETFNIQLEDTTVFKERIANVIKCAVKMGLLD